MIQDNATDPLNSFQGLYSEAGWVTGTHYFTTGVVKGRFYDAGDDGGAVPSQVRGS